MIVSIKPYYDSIAQWTKTCIYLSFWPKLVLFACNFSPLKVFAFRTFHLNNNHAQPSKNKTKPSAFITSLISIPQTSKINPSCTHWRDISPDSGGLDHRIPKWLKRCFSLLSNFSNLADYRELTLPTSIPAEAARSFSSLLDLSFSFFSLSFIFLLSSFLAQC